VAELRNISWSRLMGSLLEKESLGALVKSRSLQWALTTAFRKQGYMLLDDLDGLVLEYRGVKFCPDLINYPRIFEAWDRYDIEGIRVGDKVLDIGANIGSFTLPAIYKGATVVAVEPLFWSGLERNISLSRLGGVRVIKEGVGLRKRQVVDCQEYSKEVNCITPHELKGEYNVVRLDCGGEEKDCLSALVDGYWGKPRQLEVEFHFLTKEQRLRFTGPRREITGDFTILVVWKMWRDWLEEKGYGYLARWSKHRHWMYLSASLEREKRKEVQLIDGSFRGRNLELWKGLQ